MTTTAKLLVGLLLAIAIAGVSLFEGKSWGASEERATWQAKEAKRLKDESDARDAEMRRGEKASGALQAQLLQQQITNDQLTNAFNAYKRHNPILARSAPQPAGSASDPAQAAGRAGPANGRGPALSLGAVWMWNSALAGHDVPAGSCGLADSSEGACAADSGIPLEAAWDNQALNARLCAEDRVRHQRLIDYINGKGQ